MASSASPAWSNANAPAPLLAVPASAAATVTLAELIFTMDGDAPGCSFVEWGAGPGSATYDVHWRVTHTSWGLLHISGAAAGGYFENTWAWVADHDIDSGANLTVVNPRGVTIEGAGAPIYLYGVAAEHSALYQFNFTNVAALTALVLQTETPYWQQPQSAWSVVAVNVSGSVYGTGSYSWFYPNQTALVSVDASPSVQLYDVNTYGCETVLVGQDAITPASSPLVQNWFTTYFMADIRPS